MIYPSELHFLIHSYFCSNTVMYAFVFWLIHIIFGFVFARVFLFEIAFSRQLFPVWRLFFYIYCCFLVMVLVCCLFFCCFLNPFRIPIVLSVIYIFFLSKGYFATLPTRHPILYFFSVFSCLRNLYFVRCKHYAYRFCPEIFVFWLKEKVFLSDKIKVVSKIFHEVFRHGVSHCSRSRSLLRIISRFFNRIFKSMN